MKIAIIDKIGLCYDGNTLKKQGLGGSESAVILISKELSVIGFDVTVFNNCDDSSHSSTGVYDNVRYIDNKDSKDHKEQYDVVIVSRTVAPFTSRDYPFLHTASKRLLWLHDTFIEGDQIVEDLVVSGKINHILTLSDWHTSYILTCAHGKKRNYEVLKKSIFQTRNGAVCYIPEVDLSKKDRNQFVYNSSATKGMLPLVEHIWPEIKKQMPDAKLSIIGGYYRFREGAAPDEQENTVSELSKRQDLKDLGITFTGVIPQHEIAEILSKSSMMLYPGAFPETFGISALESLLYNTPLVTTRFGALEETAIDRACYHINYAIEPNSLFPHINKETQVQKFLETFFNAYNNPYLHQQKQNYCNVVKDIAGWDTVALQWKQFLYKIAGRFLPVDQYRTVSRINSKVARVFGRTGAMPALTEYRSFGEQRYIFVVSPFWNAEQYIQRHILSVAQQDYDNYTHVLIDDASDDNSYEVARTTIDSLPVELQARFRLIRNQDNKGAIHNQLSLLQECDPEDVVILLDGDDWLINNNTIFHYYNDLYDRGYEFTYGSMWSVVDNIPLISQEYPAEVKKTRSYRDHHFNWKIPYTHLRTSLGKYFFTLDEDKFKVDGQWMKSGHDNPLFYELIEQVESKKIYCNREVICNYNDANPLNDYKVRGTEQNENANLSYKKENKVKKILIAIPTAKYIESETFKSIYDLDVPEGYQTVFQYFYGYNIDQVRNLIADWVIKGYDYLLSVDSDIVLPKDTLTKFLAHDVDIVSGLYIQRKPGQHILEVYENNDQGGVSNIPYGKIKDKGLVPIGGCGFGCVLIKQSVFKGIPYPHFVYHSALDHANTISEDVDFCAKALKKGFKIYADTAIKCRHIGHSEFLINDSIPAVDNSIELRLRDLSSQKLLPKPHVDYLRQLKDSGFTPKTIYDVGACVLHWTNEAKQIWPESKIIAFEAMPSCEFLYKENNMTYHVGVLSDTSGKTVEFYQNDQHPGGNSYYIENSDINANSAFYFNETHRHTYQTVTLDAVFRLKQLPKPDFLKMDVQGAELDVLRGAEEVLESVEHVILELQSVEYNKGAPLREIVIEYMYTIGFELVAQFTNYGPDGDYHFKRK